MVLAPRIHGSDLKKYQGSKGSQEVIWIDWNVHHPRRDSKKHLEFVEPALLLSGIHGWHGWHQCLWVHSGLMWDCKKQYETAVPVLASCPSLGIQGITYWRIFTGQLVFFQFDHIRLAHYVGATADDVLYQSLVVVRSETDLMTHWDIHIFMCRTCKAKRSAGHPHE